jgi:prepilin-type N-terminal cleavage/methylation domain-containing protein
VREKQSKAAFTLIELLVVIAIIAILVSMLLPGLNEARLQARTVQTISNMKQIYTGVIIYVDNYDGMLCMSDTNPHPYCSDGADFPRMIAEELRGNLYDESNDVAKVEMATESMYKDLMWCGVIRGIRGYTEPHNKGRSDFSWNRYFGREQNSRRLAGLEGKIEPFMVPGTAMNSGQSANNLKHGSYDPLSQSHPAYVYSRRALFMFLDGSVHKVSVQEGTELESLINDRDNFE